MWITNRVFGLTSIKAQYSNPKFSCNFLLVSFAFHLLSSPLLFFSTATEMFPTLFSSVRDSLNWQVAQASYFLKPKIIEYGSRCLLFCQLRSYICHILLISVGNTLFMLVYFDIYSYIHWIGGGCYLLSTS